MTHAPIAHAAAITDWTGGDPLNTFVATLAGVDADAGRQLHVALEAADPGSARLVEEVRCALREDLGLIAGVAFLAMPWGGGGWHISDCCRTFYTDGTVLDMNDIGVGVSEALHKYEPIGEGDMVLVIPSTRQIRRGTYDPDADYDTTNAAIGEWIFGQLIP